MSYAEKNIADSYAKLIKTGKPPAQTSGGSPC